MYLIYLYVELRIRPNTSRMMGKRSLAELQCQPPRARYLGQEDTLGLNPLSALVRVKYMT